MLPPQQRSAQQPLPIGSHSLIESAPFTVCYSASSTDVLYSNQIGLMNFTKECNLVSNEAEALAKEPFSFLAPKRGSKACRMPPLP